MKEDVEWQTFVFFSASDSFSTMALYKSIYLLTYLLTNFQQVPIKWLSTAVMDTGQCFCDTILQNERRCGMTDLWPRTSWLDFGTGLDPGPDTGWIFQFLQFEEIGVLWMNVNEIVGVVGLWISNIRLDFGTDTDQDMNLDPDLDYSRIWTKFCGMIDLQPRTRWLDFGIAPIPDPGPIFLFFQHCKKGCFIH